MWGKAGSWGPPGTHLSSMLPRPGLALSECLGVCARHVEAWVCALPRAGL